MQFNKIKLLLLAALLLCPVFSRGQTGEPLIITADKFADDKNVTTDKLVWKYRAGDDAAWAARDFDDAAWDSVEGSSIDLKSQPASGWNGRAWYRLKFKIDEAAAAKNLSIIARHFGASEIFLDGRLLTGFGEIREGEGEIEYNPNWIPVPFKVDAGEHVLAVRYSASAVGDLSGVRGAWLKGGGVRPGFELSIREINDIKTTIQRYADTTSMRIGFLFVGVLAALALLHLLLFLFYRVERANLFYGIYAFAIALNIFLGNLQAFGHFGFTLFLITGVVASILSFVMFIALLAFLHAASGRPFNFIFWTITILWLASVLLSLAFMRNLGALRILPNVVLFAYFSYSIYLLVLALREKRAGAWILFVGVQIFAFAMLLSLLNQLNVFKLSGDLSLLQELATVLAVPLAVSVFLARNFARTNRNLVERLEEVRHLSERQIEQERRENELHLENQRRAKELEEARQLQLSMLPKTLPELPNLEIAAYMKPASEVGGDYYDFHAGADGGLTVAVGDATGHGLKAGTVVTAAKTLFKNYAEDADIPAVFKKSSRVIKQMNLRGLFMAMTMLKFKNNHVVICAAGMPSSLVFRRETGRIEEISLRAMPWGSPFDAVYQQSELTLADGDLVLLMSDGFPEMFNENGEMIGDGAASEALREAASGSPQEIINHLVETGEKWAGKRPPDDDVTFVVLKLKHGEAEIRN